jgi:hypothetical protein
LRARIDGEQPIAVQERGKRGATNAAHGADKKIAASELKDFGGAHGIIRGS